MGLSTSSVIRKWLTALYLPVVGVSDHEIPATRPCTWCHRQSLHFVVEVVGDRVAEHAAAQPGRVKECAKPAPHIRRRSAASSRACCRRSRQVRGEHIDVHGEARGQRCPAQPGGVEAATVQHDDGGSVDGYGTSRCRTRM